MNPKKELLWGLWVDSKANRDKKMLRPLFLELAGPGLSPQ